MARTTRPHFKHYFPPEVADAEADTQTSVSDNNQLSNRSLPESADLSTTNSPWNTVEPRRVRPKGNRHKEDPSSIPSVSDWQTQSVTPFDREGQLVNVGKDASSLEPQDMNANIVERFNRSGARRPSWDDRPYPQQQQTRFTSQVRNYVDTANLPVNAGSWYSRPEIPTSAELMDRPLEGDDDDAAGPLHIEVNRIKGSWASKEEYLKSHYELTREDAVKPLRDAVARVRVMPYEMEENFGGSIGIYEKVHITGVTFATRGIAVRVAFSLVRAGKKIHWDQSKRLLSGSLVILTPADDRFQTQCLVAVVAARPLAGLEQNPPEIDLYFKPEELEIDPQREWLMVEERTGFFEAERHTLLALQRLMGEPFPLSEHLVGVQQHVEAPGYVQNKPHTDLSSIFEAVEGRSYENVDILYDWPQNPKTELDKSQLSALRRILTKRLAIIQGPPGTGKTHVSVVAIKALLSNMTFGDAPIIVTCQTNHALDQLLRHIAPFEPDFIRLGGRSKDQDIVKKRTLYEVRQSSSIPNIAGGLKVPARKRMNDLTKSMSLMLDPLELGKGPLSHRVLHSLGLLTEEQCASLERGDDKYVQHGSTSDMTTADAAPMMTWLGKQLMVTKRNLQMDDFGFEYEEADLEFEQLKEMEAENIAQDDDDFETLKGSFVSLGDTITGKDAYLDETTILKLLQRKQNLWEIKSKERGSIYRYLQRQAKQKILDSFRLEAKRYHEAAIRRRTGGWEQDCVLLKKQKIIGITTTGFSKYRALVASLNPKIVLIEEAAETLEAPVIAACVPSLEHLILVGDHQQLRPHCHVQAHEGDPYNLNMSLFERMVNNDVEFDILKRQRRMIPEIRRILKPIYGDNISDHPSVKDPVNRPPVPGMGGCNSFFFTHQWPETRDEHMSSTNYKEASMIVGMFNYLIFNGMSEKDITVLTFYNGQRKAILKGLRTHPNLQGKVFKVVTVDSYQGEENEIILLSLVRSNDDGKIGFLSVDNRVCVALSRARCGFYIFGNGELLCGESKTWAAVMTILFGKKGDLPRTGPKVRVGFAVPLMCSNHEKKTFIEDPDDWEMINGGCERKCRGTLPCGHSCKLRCHPFGHDLINCGDKCARSLPCGHPCAADCCDPCRCATCVKPKKALQPSLLARDQSTLANCARAAPTLQSGSSKSEKWQTYANGGVLQDDARIADENLTRQTAQTHRRSAEECPSPLGDGNSVESHRSGSTPTLVETSGNGSGRARYVWRETYHSNDNLSREEGCKAQETLAEPPPLIDLDD